MTAVRVRDLCPGDQFAAPDGLSRIVGQVAERSRKPWDIYCTDGSRIELDADAVVDVRDDNQLAADDQVTVTMTAQEWDALLGERYMEHSHVSCSHRIAFKLREHLPGLGARRAREQAQTDALRPGLDVKALRKHLKAARWWLTMPASEDSRVSHHGVNVEFCPGWKLTVTPRGAAAKAVVIVEFIAVTRGGQYGAYRLTQAEHDLILKTVGKIFDVREHWNGAPGGSISVGINDPIHPALLAAVNRPHATTHTAPAWPNAA